MTPLDPNADPIASDAPWWLQPVYAFGIPSAIAVFLVWFVATVVIHGQNEINDKLDAQATMQQKQLLLLQEICLNGAQDDRGRARCEVTR
jgi:hypothetical protein